MLIDCTNPKTTRTITWCMHGLQNCFKMRRSNFKVLRQCLRHKFSCKVGRFSEGYQCQLYRGKHNDFSPPLPVTSTMLRQTNIFQIKLRDCNKNVCGMGLQTRSITTSSSTFVAADQTGSSPAKVDILEYIDTIQQTTGKVGVIFSDSPPVLWAVDFLCVLKDLPGMSWVSTIVLGTVFVRSLVTFPVAIVQQKAIGRLVKLKPELENLSKDLRMELAYAVKKFDWDEKTARRQYTKSYKKHWRKIVEDNNCHPMRSIALSLIQLPFWISLSSALRNVVFALPLPRTNERIERWIQIHNENLPWLHSLVLPDPIVLPAIFLGANLLNIEISRRHRLDEAIVVPQTKLQIIVPWIMRGITIIIAVIATTVPSAVSMYWATSSSIALAQTVFLRTDIAKKVFNLPMITPAEVTKPVNEVNNKQKLKKSNKKPAF